MMPDKEKVSKVLVCLGFGCGRMDGEDGDVSYYLKE
jgi:hypothetical protein